MLYFWVEEVFHLLGFLDGVACFVVDDALDTILLVPSVNVSTQVDGERLCAVHCIQLNALFNRVFSTKEAEGGMGGIASEQLLDIGSDDFFVEKL